MEDLPIGSEIVLKVVETKEADCTGFRKWYKEEVEEEGGNLINLC